MTRELVTLLGGRRIGVVERGRNDRLRFLYDDEWRTAPEAMTLSLSLPLVAREHGHAVVDAFLWNLLPDNDRILDAWGKRFQVSPRNVFALISHVGEDCAGAVQFAVPDRMDALGTGEAPQVQWLDEAGVADRLRELRRDHAAWRSRGDTGQFSLAGAQPKTALLYEEGRWGVPSGRTPTTHILKPPTAGVKGHAENEHLCLVLARAVGLPAAHSYVERFEDEVAIVIERYDRARISGHGGVQAIVRVHQEDMCQAMGLRPTSKYQSDDGPSPADIVHVLREHSSRPEEDVETFVGALAFNWLVGGTDAHAKNYSILHASRGRVRLAPLYDIASALPYPDMRPEKLKLAMKIGGRYRLREIGPAQWEDLASELDLEPPAVLNGVAALGTRIEERVAPVCQEARDAGLTDPMVPSLERALKERARSCIKRIERYARMQTSPQRPGK